MEPPYQSPQSQAQNCRTTFPFHFTYHSDFASPSLVQSELQPYMLQAPSSVLSEAQDHSQLYSQFSVVESQCQSQGLLFQAHQQAQSQSQPVKKVAPNKIWKPHHDDFLIALLVEQANQGMKIDNKTFKRQALEVAATALNHQFNESFTMENVENHMRAWKTKYEEIKRCKDIWVTAWNDDYKMITLDRATYEMYVEANPKAKDYINKPIENYEALKTIFGDEQAMGYYKKSIFQQFGTRQPATYSKNDRGSSNLDEEMEPAIVGLTCGKKRRPTNADGSSEEPPQESTKTSNSRKSRVPVKRPRENIQTAFMKVAQRVDDAATTMNDAHPASWTSELHEKIMNLDDFETSTKEAAFEALQQDEAEARAFIVKNTMMCISWMKRFAAKQQSD